MLLAITIIFLAIYTIDILALFYFGIHTYIMVYLYKKNHKYCDSKSQDPLSLKDPHLPKVTVQLPIYNEFYVVDRLIESVVKLKYPKSKLQIQVLDDSTDETVDKVEILVRKFKKSGFDIHHVHRTNRKGHKAGALKEGLQTATGDFIAIFDADFIPDSEFLLKCLPYFDDPEIGMVQTRWGHINSDYNLLTKAQSFGIDGHFMIEQVARNSGKLWMNFNGTAGIWKLACINDAGGWESDTLTEDFDLSYRAELKNWKFRYFKDIVCDSEIPATISAYKSQQFRWCKGSIQTAVKLIPRILKSDFPFRIKAEAITHLINYFVHPLMVINILFSGPLLLMEYWSSFALYDLPAEILLGTAAFLSIGSLGPVLFYAYSQRELYPDWKKRILFIPFLMMLGTGIAIVNTVATIEALLGIKSGFKRTPKLKIESKEDKVISKVKYALPLDGYFFYEILLGLYCVSCIYFSFIVKKPFIVGFLVIYAFGFFYVAVQTLKEGLNFSNFKKVFSISSLLQRTKKSLFQE